MKPLPAGLSSLLIALLAAPLAAAPAGAAEPPSAQAVLFGMDAGSVGPLSDAGAKPDVATLWIGPWTLSSGWGGPDATLASLAAAGVTPAIHFYYWGDDISPSCLENGCWSTLHKAQKDKAGWQKLADQLVEHLNAKMGGKPVLVFLETEFNKGSVATYEPLDGYLAEKAAQVRKGYPAAKVVLALGNWNSAAWTTWDRTAAASDLTGIQGMRGSTRDSASSYDGLYDATLAGAKKLQQTFAKPIILQDVALSSYPEPDYLQKQADALARFFSGLGALREAGVQALVYRSWKDAPGMDTANYYGQAERHWGLAYSGSGGQKPAAKAWLDGVAAERSRAAAPANTPPMAAFTLGSSGLTVNVDGAPSTDADGDPLSYAWSFGDGASASGPSASHTYAAAGTYTVVLTVSDGSASASATRSVTASAPYTARFTPKGNEWWVETWVTASQPTTKVEAKVGDGAWIGLPPTSYGGWAKSIHAPKGSPVTFRATSTSGEAVLSATYSWLGDKPGFTATFTPKAQSNPWWVESAVKGSEAVAKVEARVNGGTWTQLPSTDWGTWAKSIRAQSGSRVEFRATGASGGQATSPAYSWG